jgi:hypothetical protein
MSLVLSDFGAAKIESRKRTSKIMINFNSLHQILGHCGETSTRLTGKDLGYDIVGTFGTF